MFQVEETECADSKRMSVWIENSEQEESIKAGGIVRAKTSMSLETFMRSLESFFFFLVPQEIFFLMCQL